MKVKQVDEVLRGPKHKVPERTAIFDPKTEELTKNKMAEQDLPEVSKKK